MNRGFYTILLAQFLSALADNALFIAALQLLRANNAPSWQNSLLLEAFTLFYIVLAPFVGSFADAMPKGRVMFLCNSVKLMGCLAMLSGLHPLLAYAIVGFGAAAYSPAKYGIITEYLPHDQLVAANAWLEGLTVGAIIFGTVLGGTLAGPKIEQLLLAHQQFGLGAWLTAPIFAVMCIITLYLAAAWVNLFIPKLNIDHKPPKTNPWFLIQDFAHCVALLWRDREGQMTLAVTTLFWGAGSTMRLVVLDWGRQVFQFTIDQATAMVAVVAVGTAAGAVLAGRWVKLKHAFHVLPAGMMMGLLVLSMLWVKDVWLATLLLLLVGGMGGFFVVPLNAMLQHRGHVLMGAGHSIAVQNFNEHLGILVMVQAHGLMMLHGSPSSGEAPLPLIIISFGCFVLLVMSLVYALYLRRRSWLQERYLHKDW